MPVRARTRTRARVSPLVAAAVYAHPIEHIFSNMLPIAAGPLIMGRYAAVNGSGDTLGDDSTCVCACACVCVWVGVCVRTGCPLDKHASRGDCGCPPRVLSRCSHPVIACVWSCNAVVNTMIGHSGYVLPFTRDPYGHDWHHEKFDECFGTLDVLDYVHGTNKKFLESVARGGRVFEREQAGTSDVATAAAASNSSPSSAAGAKPKAA
ncbi:hypothetical protein EON67_08460 [archaeon]|nr:MAG: hypothetical protein EON67_08460 [archaeon]